MLPNEMAVSSTNARHVILLFLNKQLDVYRLLQLKIT